MKPAKLILHIDLDINNFPEKLGFETDDDNSIDRTEVKSFLLSLWDKKDSETIKVDLWTKDMQIEEMSFFYYQTLLSMADTFEKATGQTPNADLIRNFAKHFYEQTQQNFEIK